MQTYNNDAYFCLERSETREKTEEQEYKKDNEFQTPVGNFKAR